MVTVRRELPDDIASVRALNEAAFGQPAESGMVDSIRAACSDVVSLVAVEADRIKGYIFFSPVVVPAANIQGMGLAPMAVQPEYQRQGVGSLLSRAGIDALRERDCPFIIVLGHPGYYPRFSGMGLQAQGTSKKTLTAMKRSA